MIAVFIKNVYIFNLHLQVFIFITSISSSFRSTPEQFHSDARVVPVPWNVSDVPSFQSLKLVEGWGEVVTVADEHLKHGGLVLGNQRHYRVNDSYFDDNIHGILTLFMIKSLSIFETH